MQGGFRQAFNGCLAIVAFGMFAGDEQMLRRFERVVERFSLRDGDHLGPQSAPFRHLALDQFSWGKADRRLLIDVSVRHAISCSGSPSLVPHRVFWESTMLIPLVISI